MRSAGSENNMFFPSDFMVVATTNPCPCGNYPDRTKCKCTVSQRIHYRKKVSRPVLERFDMILWQNRLRLKILMMILSTQIQFLSAYYMEETDKNYGMKKNRFLITAGFRTIRSMRSVILMMIQKPL